MKHESVTIKTLISNKFKEKNPLFASQKHFDQSESRTQHCCGINTCTQDMRSSPSVRLCGTAGYRGYQGYHLTYVFYIWIYLAAWGLGMHTGCTGDFKTSRLDQKILSFHCSSVIVTQKATQGWNIKPCGGRGNMHKDNSTVRQSACPKWCTCALSTLSCSINSQ